MNRTIELSEAVFVALELAARADGTTAADWIAARVQSANPSNSETATTTKDWLDRDFLKTYTREADESIVWKKCAKQWRRSQAA